jgi:transcriptional regulator of acetoin/glycerol metabolism
MLLINAIMGFDQGATTVTGAGARRPAPPNEELTLVWVFPQVGLPPVSLREVGRAGEEVVVIGRDASCAVRLEGNDVSRRHAALSRTSPEGELVIEDLDSRNGIHVNGHQVRSATLARDDVLRVGGWIGVVTAAPGDFGEVAPGLWGGAALAAAVEPLRRSAASDLPIVLEGETGTGKELVARAIHAWSGRSGPFIGVNCGALPEALAEAELFGYRKGAFTGADRSNPGLFRSADGGTLLLDEVSDLALSLQPKLLRILEQREVHPIGEARPVAVDVRIIVAGQQPLMEAAREGRFRGDLLARIDGFTARLPPLRRRREDVPRLFSQLFKTLGHGWVPAVEGDLVERLCAHDWPFNVREMVLLVRRLVTLFGGQATLRAEHLPERVGTPGGGLSLPGSVPVRASRPLAPSSPSSPSPVVSGAEPVDLPALIVALRASGGNVARAAAMLGITRQRAYRLMEGQSVDLGALRKTDEGGR